MNHTPTALLAGRMPEASTPLKEIPLRGLLLDRVLASGKSSP